MGTTVLSKTRRLWWEKAGLLISLLFATLAHPPASSWVQAPQSLGSPRGLRSIAPPPPVPASEPRTSSAQWDEPFPLPPQARKRSSDGFCCRCRCYEPGPDNSVIYQVGIFQCETLPSLLSLPVTPKSDAFFSWSQERGIKMLKITQEVAEVKLNSPKCIPTAYVNRYWFAGAGCCPTFLVAEILMSHCLNQHLGSNLVASGHGQVFSVAWASLVKHRWSYIGSLRRIF